MKRNRWSARARPGRVLLVSFLLVFSLLAGPSLYAQDRTPGEAPAYVEEGVLVRVGGNVNVEADEREAVVVVVEGEATVAGAAEVVVVVNGQATLTGARVGELIVVEGEAALGEGTVVTGNVQLVDAQITARAADAVVQGEVRHGVGYQLGLMFFGVLFGLGVTVVVLLSGLIAAAVAPHGMRAAGATITDAFGKTLLATLAVGVGLPLLAVMAFFTIVGIPAGLAILLILLPALGYVGYLVAGIRLGDYVLGVVRGHDEAWHPYQAAVTGLGLLLVLGWVPVVGGIVSPVAGLLGAGALAFRAWQRATWPGVQGNKVRIG